MIEENLLERLIQEYVDGSLDPEGRRSLEDAVSRDPRVVDRIRDYQWIHGALPESFVRPASPSADLPDRVVGALEARQGERLKERTLEALSSRSRSSTRRRRGRENPAPLMGWLIAAGVLLGFVGLLLFSSSGTPVRPPVRPAPPVARQTLPRSEPSTAVVRPRPIVIQPGQRPIPSRQQRRTDRPLPKSVHPAPAPPNRPVAPVLKPSRPEAPRPPAATVASVATLEQFEGPAPLLLGNASRAVAAGETLRAGQGLRLPETTQALVRYPDGTWVRLSRGALVEDLRSEGGKRLLLKRGSLEADVARQPAREPMVVLTPNAEARVVGTRLSLTVEPGRTRLEVSEGRVRLLRLRDGMSVFVTEGHFAVAAPGAPLVAERIASAAAPIWISALDRSARFRAPMTAARAPVEGSLSGRPVFASTDNRALPAAKRSSLRSLIPDTDEGGWVTYTVRIPSEGEWFLWARLFSPGDGVLWKRADGTGDDPNSFYLRVDDGPERILGNLRRDPASGTSFYRRWYWGGDGRREEGTPSALPLGTLRAGNHLIRIRNRDAVETASLRLSPRLDVLCLTRDPAYVPRDADVRLGR